MKQLKNSLAEKNNRGQEERDKTGKVVENQLDKTDILKTKCCAIKQNAGSKLLRAIPLIVSVSLLTRRGAPALEEPWTTQRCKEGSEPSQRSRRMSPAQFEAHRSQFQRFVAVR